MFAALVSATLWVGRGAAERVPAVAIIRGVVRRGGFH